MNYRKTLLFNTLGLPAYWRACREEYARMNVREEKVSYGSSDRQYALVVTSRDIPPVSPAKYVVYLHGGAWTFGSPEKFVAAAIPWLAAGYRVILPSYRRPPAVGLNEVVADCWSAVRACAPAETVAEFQIAGISAGAHLAALLALDPAGWRRAGWPAAPTAALCCAGPLNFAFLRPRRLFLPRYTLLDPIQRLSEVLPNPDCRWQLLHGTADATVDVRHSNTFYQELLNRGAAANLHHIPNGTHLDSGRWMFSGHPLRPLIDQFIVGPKR
ncbi:alpha/beta hydrolase [Neolewinella agarilytica]|uniref:alpha/beta hydrolase n=1 Tax=Neolewinella agarilytica TaxID=478744 RepID=UPI002352FDA4|nr:alpha/beta hydrolase [Neolewinella agarilytica]